MTENVNNFDQLNLTFSKYLAKVDVLMKCTRFWVDEVVNSNINIGKI